MGPVSLGLSNVTLSVSYPIKYIEGLSVEAGISEPIGDDKLQTDLKLNMKLAVFFLKEFIISTKPFLLT